MSEKDVSNKIIESSQGEPELNTKYLTEQLQDPQLKVGERKNRFIDSFRRMAKLSNFNPDLLQQGVNLVNSLYMVDRLPADDVIKIFTDLAKAGEELIKNDNFIRKEKIGSILLESINLIDNYRIELKRDKNFRENLSEYTRVLVDVLTSRPNLFSRNLGTRDKSGKLANYVLVQAEIDKRAREKGRKKGGILGSLKFLV